MLIPPQDVICPKFFYGVPELNWYAATKRYPTRCYHENCQLETWVPPYCDMHRDLSQLWLGPSTVNKAGKGLFALDDRQAEDAIIFNVGAQICLYGDVNVNVISKEELRRIYGPGRQIYAFETRDGVIYDCASVRYIGAYVNSSENTGYRPNARFCYNDKLCWLEAIRPINNGDEILIMYGDDYWTQNHYTYLYTDSIHIPEWYKMGLEDLLCDMNLSD